MEETNISPVVIIMAGGSGTRFWPLSSKELPKQYLSLYSEHSLIQETVNRALELTSAERIFISSGKSQEALIKKHLPQIKNLILEPSSRNTAPCLMLSVAHLRRLGFPPETPLCIFPADHCIENTTQFLGLMKKGLSFIARHKALLTFGITPTTPHTGYGYIEGGDELAGGILKATRFLEKPNESLAQSFLKQGSFFWNSGIFVWRLETICEAFDHFLQADWNALVTAKSPNEQVEIFNKLKNEPIDKAILEKAQNVCVMPSPHLGWSDLGSWGALHDLKADSPQENILSTPSAFLKNVEGCLVQTPPGIQVGLVGVKNLVVVLTKDSLLIMDKSQDQSVKEVSSFFNRVD